MKVYNNPDVSTWNEIIQRPQLELSFLKSSVRNILKRVKDCGDTALRELTLQFDKVDIQKIQVTDSEMLDAEQKLAADLKEAIRIAAVNIRKFHSAQKAEYPKVETMPGVT